MPSLLISIEGGEGAGKSTQGQLLARHFINRGYGVILTREPGGTNLGNTIRQLFLQGESLTPTTELFLLLSDRAHHVAHVIRPALNSGKIVITDRFVDSTIAYQGFGHGLDREWIEELNYRATEGLMPHLTLWLDIDPRLGLERAAVKNPQRDRIEKFDFEFHQRVREGFRFIKQREPNRVKVIDGSKTPAQVSESIIGLCQELLQDSLS